MLGVPCSDYYQTYTTEAFTTALDTCGLVWCVAGEKPIESYTRLSAYTLASVLNVLRDLPSDHAPPVCSWTAFRGLRGPATDAAVIEKTAEELQVWALIDMMVQSKLLVKQLT